MIKFNNYAEWLIPTTNYSKAHHYRHLIIREEYKLREKFYEKFKFFIHQAHEDARRHLREIAGISLAPFDFGEDYPDPAQDYPKSLDIVTLQGYFGEVLAGFVIQNFSPFLEESWKVPCFLFRFHKIAFQHLELLHQTKEKAKKIPGRTGDDCLAFQMDDKGNIKKSLVCEAKCTFKHNSNLISDAHVKLNEKNLKPVDTLQVIEVLKDYNEPDKLKWIKALRTLHLTEQFNSDYERCDFFIYVYGRAPVKSKTASWMQIDKPHEAYRAGRKLDVVEVHFHNLADLVYSVYDKEKNDNAMDDQEIENA